MSELKSWLLAALLFMAGIASSWADEHNHIVRHFFVIG